MNNVIPTNQENIMNKQECSKCDGKGKIEGFGHIANGKCFRCWGSGYTNIRVPNHVIVAAAARDKAEAKVKADKVAAAKAEEVLAAAQWEECRIQQQRHSEILLDNFVNHLEGLRLSRIK